MSSEYDGEDSHGKRNFENTARGKRVLKELNLADPLDSEVFPEVTLTDEYVESNEIPKEYLSSSKLESIVEDWNTTSPISPLVPLSENLFNNNKLLDRMSLVSGINETLERQITSISSAEDAVKLFRAMRRYTGIHMKDIFDDDWLQIRNEPTYIDGKLHQIVGLLEESGSGMDRIMEGYPYANVRFSINMPDGIDKHEELITFTSGDVTIFGNQFGKPSNLFCTYGGLLFLASSYESSVSSTREVFVHGDGCEVSIESAFKEFYNARTAKGKDYSTDIILSHMRELFVDNDKFRLSAGIKKGISFDEIWVANDYLNKAIDEFVQSRREELITDSDLDSFISKGISFVSERIESKLKRGDTPLYKLEMPEVQTITDSESDDVYKQISGDWSALQEERVRPLADE